MMSTGVRTSFKKGDQVLNAYGRLNNRNLLLDYGFAISENRYDTVYFLLWLPCSGREGLVKFEDVEAKSEEYMNGTDLYGLKMKRLNLDVFVYFRENLGVPVKNFPSELEIEIKIIDKFFDILNEMKCEFSTNIEFDNELLTRDLQPKLRSAVYYRLNQKNIVENQIKMLCTLKNELISIQNGTEITEILAGKNVEQVLSVYPLRVYLRALESYLKKP